MIGKQPRLDPLSTGMPEKIGRYRIAERIGKGAMGIVYGAVDEAMDRHVAIKVMMADLEGDPDTRARFHREAQAAARLVHQNIITIFDIGEADGRSFIVMELLRGRPLPDHLKATEPGLEKKLDLMIQLCEALAVAHTGGVFHRDIKPGNLFIQNDGLLKVLDFGIARLSSSTMTTSGFVVGTPDYMSPEQARGKGIDCRSDIFSVGGVFYFILTGRKPFPAADLPAVLHKVEREDPLPLRDHECPSPLARVVMKALAKERERRYQKCQDILFDLLRFKRYYESETRRIAETARGLYQEIEALIARTTQAETELRLSETHPSGVLEALNASHPSFADRRAEAFAAFPFERTHITTVSADLCAERDRLSAHDASLRAADNAIREGDALMAAGDARKALHRYERASQAFPASERAREAAAAARDEAGRQELRDEQIRALLKEAADAAHSADWRVAVELCDRALEIDSRRTSAVELRERAVQAIQREEQQRAKALLQAVDQFDKALAAGRLGDAEGHIRAAVVSGADDTSRSGLERRLADACAAVAAAEALAARTSAEIARARSEFAQGAHQEALDALTAFASAEPGAKGVHAEIERMASERERIADRARLLAKAGALIEQADVALARDDAAGAAGHAEAALKIDSSNPRATQILAAARVRLQQAVLAAQRAAAAAQHMRVAREKLARGAFPKALRAARAAVDADPGDGAAAALLAEVVDRQTSDEAAKALAAAAAQRAKAAAPALSAAKKSLRSGQYDRAAWAAENAAALSPESKEAREILAQAQTALAAQTTRRTDETVDSSQPGSDETRTLVAPNTTIVRAVEVVSHVGQMATGFWKRMQSNRGQVTTEWIMIAGVFVAVTMFISPLFRQALMNFVRSIAMGIRTVAP